MSAQTFTPRSARRALLALRPTLAGAARLYRALERRAPLPGAAERPVDPAYFAGVRRLLRAVEEVRRAGAEVSDLRRGLVRFPARRGGADVALWWELAEPHALWHEPVPRLRAAAEEDGGWEEPA